MSEIPEVQEWQLQRILDSFDRLNIPGLRVKGFRFDKNHRYINEVKFEGSRIVYERGLTTGEFEWFESTWFTASHSALRIDYGANELVVGIWTDAYETMRNYLGSMLDGRDMTQVGERALWKVSQAQP